MNNTNIHILSSKLIKKDYPIYVNAPLLTKENKDKKFMTVYILDADYNFPLLTAYSKYLKLAGELPEIILVGIAYETDDWQKGNTRGTDYTAPATGREHYGGADKFQEMLNDELFPLIEKTYPSDKNKRIIFGQSLGGQFVLYNAMFYPDNFYGHIASNPAIHRNHEYFIQTFKKTKKHVKLFISRARNDEKRFIDPLNKWLEHWQNNTHPWKLKEMWLEGHNHFSTSPEAFRNGMKWLLQ
jgi:predicted alpha/beta superfamily hydrolase